MLWHERYRDVSVDGVAVCLGNLFGRLGKCSVGLRYVGRFRGLLQLGTRGCLEKVLLKRMDVLPGPAVLLAQGLDVIASGCQGQCLRCMCGDWLEKGTVLPGWGQRLIGA